MNITKIGSTQVFASLRRKADCGDLKDRIGPAVRCTHPRAAQCAQPHMPRRTAVNRGPEEEEEEEVPHRSPVSAPERGIGLPSHGPLMAASRKLSVRSATFSVHGGST